MEPDVDQEIKDTLRIYKIAGPVIIIILLIGILYATLHKAPQPHPTPQPAVIPTPPHIPEKAQLEVKPTPIPLNITRQTTLNASQNATLNISTENAANQTNATAPTPAPKSIKLAWEGITITFPDSLKKIPIGGRTHYYIEILEADGTPVTNGEQFDLSFILNDHHGRDAEIKPSFENNKWLIDIIVASYGSYTLTVTITCADKNGYCKRLYSDGSTQKSTELEVV